MAYTRTASICIWIWCKSFLKDFGWETVNWAFARSHGCHHRGRSIHGCCFGPCWRILGLHLNEDFEGSTKAWNESTLGHGLMGRRVALISDTVTLTPCAFHKREMQHTPGNWDPKDGLHTKAAEGWWFRDLRVSIEQSCFKYQGLCGPTDVEDTSLVTCFILFQHKILQNNAKYAYSMLIIFPLSCGLVRMFSITTFWSLLGSGWIYGYQGGQGPCRCASMVAFRWIYAMASMKESSILQHSCKWRNLLAKFLDIWNQLKSYMNNRIVQSRLKLQYIKEERHTVSLNVFLGYSDLCVSPTLLFLSVFLFIKSWSFPRCFLWILPQQTQVMWDKE